MMLTPEQEKMVENNKRLVNYFLKKFNISYGTCEYSTKEAAGLFGLCKAAQTYDESRGIKFSTYAARCITNEILMIMRNEKKHDKDISLNTVLNEDKEGNNLTYNDILKDPNSDFEEKIYDNETVLRLLTYTLNYLDSNKCVVFLYWLSGLKQPEIAKIMNFSQSYASRLISQAIVKLKILEKSAPIRGGVFSVSCDSSKYIITFSSDITLTFMHAYSKLLDKLDSKQPVELYDFFSSPPRYKIGWVNRQITLYLPTTSDSFTFLAVLMQEFDSSKNIAENANKVSSQTSFVAQKIKEYILGLNDEFTFETVAEHFGNAIGLKTIQNNLQILKLKRKIRITNNGKYVVVKNDFYS